MQLDSWMFLDFTYTKGWCDYIYMYREAYVYMHVYIQ